MALKITCPHCSTAHRLGEPYPVPGVEVHCNQCGRTLSISYPEGMIERLRRKGVAFTEPETEPPPAEPVRPVEVAPLPPSGGRRAAPRKISDFGQPVRIQSDGNPDGEPTARGPRRPPEAAPRRPRRRKRSLLSRLVRGTAFLIVFGAFASFTLVGCAFWHYGKDLPTISKLASYTPPTVTVVNDQKGRLLGEIYEKRRYVVPLEEIPDVVQNAFIAAEDANFWTHAGIDYEGILRAIGRNVVKGKKAQGASTITMQVTRNFLLTSEKTYARKIKEVILARRIEQAFTKEHILHLYLNQIYLGSGAYGVEAAARTYYGKSIRDVTLAEAAIIAGLPQRPSDYSPHRHWDKARARQGYVLDQMMAKGYIDGEQHTAARAEPVDIVERTNEFLKQAPYFTEHVRRYLVETYGFDKVYNDGLIVDSTCDLELQREAQKAVEGNVTIADNRVGWRGTETILEGDAIKAQLDKQETELRDAASKGSLTVAAVEDGGGYGPVPERSVLGEGERYEAVVLETAKKHLVVGVGAHRALVPLSWTKWAYEPNPKRSWKYRGVSDLSKVFTKGQVVQVTIEALSSEDVKNLKGYKGAGDGPFAAARLYQSPELEGALFSYRLSDGAVLSMVGGVDFEESEYNRATQARRQVGSTFKPIVYAAAIATEKFTVGSMVQDAPTVFQTLGDKLWKPGNYGGEYLGNISLRRALQMSRNVCTVRVLDKIGLDPVFSLAGPALRIGYSQPTCERRHISEDAECAGEMTPSPVAGMAWCEWCVPTSCPKVKPGQQTLRKDGHDLDIGEAMACIDPAESSAEWCHSCDVNLRVCDWLPVEQIPKTDPCVDARLDSNGRQMCRSCDLSMGLGSSSLTMVELARAYSAFATYGKLVEPHYINRVLDRDGTVIEEWKPPEGGWEQVMDASVAGIAHWLVREVAVGGTGARSNRLGITVAGKTGTTNDFFDAWFVGYNTELITASWVGFDKPRSMGTSFTGGQTALPIWMDFMRVAAPRDQDKRFPPLPGVEWVPIDESTGRVANGGRVVPMLPGTAPTNVIGNLGDFSPEDLMNQDF